MKVNCYKASIDCQKNDPVDIKCGGPEYLGYDFFIDCESTKEMIDYIKETCNELNVPIELLPPPTHAHTTSGSSPVIS